MASRDSLIRDILDCVPPGLRKRTRVLFDSLSDDHVEWLHQALTSAPLGPRILRKIVALLTAPFAWLAVAIVGPINTGKSTLFNALAGVDLAETSPIPGTTSCVQQETILGFTVSDTPGADEAAAPERRNRAFEAASKANLIVLVYDASRGITESDRVLRERLLAYDVPIIVVLNKIDLVQQEREAVVSRAARDLDIEPGDVLPVSATQKLGLEDPVRALLASSPELAVAIGQALPAHRDRIANWLIASACASATAIGASPIPGVDIVPLTAVQASLVLGLARLYGQPMTPARARELLPTLAGAFAWRELFRQLSKLIPGPGWVLSGAIAGAGTYVVGVTAKAFFKSGQKMPEADKAALYRDMKTEIRREVRASQGDEEAIAARLEQDLETS